MKTTYWNYLRKELECHLPDEMQQKAFINEQFFYFQVALRIILVIVFFYFSISFICKAKAKRWIEIEDGLEINEDMILPEMSWFTKAIVWTNPVLYLALLILDVAFFLYMGTD